VVAGRHSAQPALATGTKDQDASRVFYEPLASWDSDGNLVPILAAEVPTRQASRPRKA
jgi:peptide/nickel transport system substrate-binding protein